MTPSDAVPAAVSSLLAVIAVVPQNAHEELALSSLQVIQMVDAIELAFDVIVPTDAITRANFATPASIARLLSVHGVRTSD